ncbi:hypothetical protein Tsubulata_008421 [Turnera subulata]|uniref:CCHC-type domain-containing protein n=1 Tax=Turnera subulata TaxID=218843 RepID=A0A9Q0G9I3_9ROSI|nr:hypothetical protein Tsubulata_008421 [Turnera subulata]
MGRHERQGVAKRSVRISGGAQRCCGGVCRPRVFLRPRRPHLPSSAAWRQRLYSLSLSHTTVPPQSATATTTEAESSTVTAAATAAQKHWVKIKYERLGEFCYRCGRITHTIRKCPRPPRQDEGMETESVLSVGPWMRAKEVVGKYYPGKKQNNGEEATVKETTLERENSYVEQTQAEEVNTHTTEVMNQEAPVEQQAQGVAVDATRKKRKAADVEVRGSAEIIAKRVHQGWINSMEELVAYHPTRSELERKKEMDSWVLGVTEQFEIALETDMTGDGSLALPSEPE